MKIGEICQVGIFMLLTEFILDGFGVSSAREDDGKWKHDLFEDKDVEEGQIVSILHMISVYFSGWIFFSLLTISLTVISDKMNFHLLLLGVMCGSDLDASVTQRSLVFESCIMFKSGLGYCLDLPPEHFRFTCYIDR